MYIVFTPVGLDTVAGCQGRYIIPALFPTLFVLTSFSGKTYVKNRLLSVLLPAVLVAVLAILGVAGMKSASLIMLVMIPLSIFCARILWKKGIVKVVENKVVEKTEEKKAEEK